MAVASVLPTTDSLRVLQDYVWQINKEREFNDDPTQKLLMLTEEVGELAKAIRKTAGMKFTETTRQTEAAEEIADVLIVLLSLGTMLDVDVYQAFLDKETKNRKRVWA